MSSQSQTLKSMENCICVKKVKIGIRVMNIMRRKVSLKKVDRWKLEKQNVYDQSNPFYRLKQELNFQIIPKGKKIKEKNYISILLPFLS